MSQQTTAEECILWTGAMDAGGYGYMYGRGDAPAGANQTSVRHWRGLVHRLVWAQRNGPIPTGMCVCHRCDVRNCMNPAHLFLGTPMDNSRDMVAKGRSCRRTHCVRGHELPPYRAGGVRRCLPCHRAHMAAYRARRR